MWNERKVRRTTRQRRHAGSTAGQVHQGSSGQAFLDKIETIRQLAKSSRKGNETDRERLLDTLRNLSDDELLPVARAFSQFLNLANVAEQFHTISVAAKSRSAPRIRSSRCSTS